MGRTLGANNWEEEARAVFVHPQARSSFGAGVIWVTQSTSRPNIESLLTAWKTTRDQTRRCRACGTGEQMDDQLAHDERGLFLTGDIHQKLCWQGDRSVRRAPSCHVELAA